MRTLLFIVPRAAPERDAHRSISKCARPTRQAANTPVTRARQEALSLSRRYEDKHGAAASNEIIMQQWMLLESGLVSRCSFGTNKQTKSSE
jgi:hypothetical protein